MTTTTRDYNKEAKDHPDHKYAYDFDYRMHHFMMRTFLKFKPGGKALELGCYHGAFTQIILKHFEDVTVIEASDECIGIANERTGGKARFINSTFEGADLKEQFDAVFLIHTLEHIDDHVGVLSKIKQWIKPGGLLFMASPNANAPSRQIAVKMGLITHNSAITPAEKEHGHTVTYTLDTFERDAVKAGLSIVHRGGVFFKGLANFQIDKAFAAGIISEEYLEGCYQLGTVYPDLCSSIYLVCTV